MTTKSYGKNHSGKVTIQRVHEYELDFAIEELEKRGYKLEKRGVTTDERKKFSYHENRGPKLKFAGSDSLKKCWAVMRKELIT